MTIDEHLASQALASTLDETHDSTTNLDPIFIPGHVEQVQTEGADIGVGYNLAHASTSGLTIVIPVYLNMAPNDWIEVFWGDDVTPVASALVPDTAVGDDYSMYVPSAKIPQGVHPLYCKITRAGGGNGGESSPINVLARFDFPGGIDPAPDDPGHQNLVPPEPELPTSGIIDEEAAKDGVKVTILAYPHMRQYDKVTLSWGGVMVRAEVTQAEVDIGLLEILVPEEVILAAGASDQLILIYRVVDEVENQSSDWSPRTYVMVEVGEDLLPAPDIVNPDEDTSDWYLIDLDELGDDDLVVEVMVISGGALQVGDEVAVRWVGTTSLGQDIVAEPEPQLVSRPSMVMKFDIPNGDLRQLAGGRGVVSYSASRGGVPLGLSKRTFVTFLGVDQGLPKPSVPEAVAGALDPQLATASVVVPGEVLQSGDMVFLTWLGTRANGTPLLYTPQRPVSGGGAGQPMTFDIDGPSWIAPLDGGKVSVFYRLGRSGADLPLESAREELRIGEAAAELPAPSTRPPAQGGMLDPDNFPSQLEIVVVVYPNMADGQTVHLLWRASKGPNHSDSVPITEFSAGHEVVFTMTPERVRENLGAEVEISYWVEEEGRPPRMSGVTVVGIGALELPLAVFTAATAGNQLDLSDVRDGAEVLIDEAADFAAGDKVTVQVISDVSGGTHSIDYEVLPGDDGRPVRVVVPYEVIAASLGTEITLSYELRRATGGPVEASDRNFYQVSAMGTGTLLVMGARYSATSINQNRAPRTLSAFDARSLQPLRAEWRYDGESAWTADSQWFDTKPWLKLYVRGAEEAVVLNPANIVGNGGGFVAVRDERAVVGGTEVDMVAWGTKELGGELDPVLINLKDIVEVTATTRGFAARRRNKGVVCWGDVMAPGEVDDFVEVRSNDSVFVGKKTGGRLYAWGTERPDSGAPVPPEVARYTDYVEIRGGVQSAVVARRATGHVVAWGHPNGGGELGPGQDTYNDITQVICGGNASAAMRGNPGSGRIIAWGINSLGGDPPDYIDALTNVKRLAAATGVAFVAILATNAVRGWGHYLSGGDIPTNIQSLTNVVEVSATGNAFCARLETGQVVAWPKGQLSGDLPDDIGFLSNIVQVVGNSSSFAALCRDGSVVAWGAPQTGADLSQVAEQLTNVRAIYAAAYSFTALTADGRVVTWGMPESGGDSSKVQHELVGKVSHSRRIPLEEAEAISPSPALTLSGEQP